MAMRPYREFGYFDADGLKSPALNSERALKRGAREEGNLKKKCPNKGAHATAGGRGNIL